MISLAGARCRARLITRLCSSAPETSVLKSVAQEASDQELKLPKKPAYRDLDPGMNFKNVCDFRHYVGICWYMVFDSNAKNEFTENTLGLKSVFVN